MYIYLTRRYIYIYIIYVCIHVFKEAFDGKSYMELYRKDQVSVRKNSKFHEKSLQHRV